MRLPAEFAVPRPGIAVRRGFEAQLDGWLAAARDGAPPGEHADTTIAGGRGTVRRIALEGGGDAYLRRYVHGGLLRALLRDLYWQRPLRPWRELVATEAARRAGVVAPEVLAAAALPLAAGSDAPGVVYRGVLVTRALAGRRALGDALRGARDAAERRAWLGCAVSAVRALHAAGIEHRDLNVSNVLVAAHPEEPAAVIDFDRATVRARPLGGLGVGLAVRRLSRSIAKLGIAGLDRRGAAAALRAAGLGGAP